MAVFKVETKNKVDIDKKPRVYFTCHPEDFDKHFKKICEDIFKTHDCAIYYTEDMSEVIADDEKQVDLGRNNLFVVPVTFKLLTTSNRAIDEDIPYALKEHIPILPIMMEPGIDEFYSKPDKFGEMQYLNPYSTDLTEISYEEKLKKYLESVLISDELAKRVRAAFDAYIFLSYRKKDRKYANELMRLIHSNPEYRDIAIWFDEFLTPGESFKENIEKIMDDCKLFTLLVTPNLLDETDGKPNFVMGEEYPAARKSGTDILPAEMENTNKQELFAKFEALPDPVDPHNDEAFKIRLTETLARLAIKPNNNDPEHKYLIGIAYLEGIDVEINRELAIELITSAADEGLIEAMEKLRDMYFFGFGTDVDYLKAVDWAERHCKHMISQYGEEHPDTLVSTNNLATIYFNVGEIKKALKIEEKNYFLRRKIFGEEYRGTLTALNNLALIYLDLGDYETALKAVKKVYAIRCKLLGKNHAETLNALNDLALIYQKLGMYKEALEFGEEVYTQRCKLLGEEHFDTSVSLNNLAMVYGKVGDHKKDLELNEKVYSVRCKTLGERHPETLTSLNNLAVSYMDLGAYEKALELIEKAYIINCEKYGEENKMSLTFLNNLASVYGKVGDYEKELELSEKVYSVRCRVLGEEHPDTLISLNNIAITYENLGVYNEALKYNEKLYAIRCKILGKTHKDTLKVLNYIGWDYLYMRKIFKGLKILILYLVQKKR